MKTKVPPCKRLSYAVLVLMCLCDFAQAQTTDSLKNKRSPYFRKEEIIYQNKRYRIHNNYLTLGGGFLGSTLRDDVQNVVAADYQFHIRRQQFQIGAMMSGEEFLSNNYTQVHLGYGYRIEKYTSNYAAFLGPTYFSGVAGKVGQPEDFFSGFGVYASVQAVYKFAYDIGLGAELFAEANYKHSMVGIKFVAFFSGAYRGAKKRVNPNVRTPSNQ
jgi:hypothetical protein